MIEGGERKSKKKRTNKYNYLINNRNKIKQKSNLMNNVKQNNELI